MNDKEIKKLEETAKEFERMDLCAEIDKVRTIIQDFAEHDLYSANCEEVRYLYKRLRELENRVDEIDEEEDDYGTIFIDGSDVPINGYYE